MNMPVLQKQAMEEIMQRLNASSAREELMSEFCRDYKEVCLICESYRRD